MTKAALEFSSNIVWTYSSKADQFPHRTWIVRYLPLDETMNRMTLNNYKLKTKAIASKLQWTECLENLWMSLQDHKHNRMRWEICVGTFERPKTEWHYYFKDEGHIKLLYMFFIKLLCIIFLYLLGGIPPISSENFKHHGDLWLSHGLPYCGLL